MAEPRVIPRAEHTISRRGIDPDALKVLYRLRQHEHIAYLVGGSVRDLLLGRRPKDFDIGTSAHPYEVKKLFRNCWIIGRRFRLAHIRFGQKVVEVATFRRQLQPGEEIVQDGVPAPEPALAEETPAVHGGPPRQAAPQPHHDNTFGTPEEDAFRRDFTINALFYDIATFSIIDYVNGLDDLRAGIVRSIGDPDVRFVEDPVRMLRAVAFSARLDFTIEGAILDAIRRHRHEIARSSPARLLEEYDKILRSGYAEKTFRQLAALGLLEPISHELHKGADDPLWRMLAALDTYRRTHETIPETLTNAVLLGTLIVPLGFTAHVPRHDDESRPAGVRLGDLPLARRDIERLRQMLGMQRRLQDSSAHSRVRHGLMHRSIFSEALTWMEIHGNAPEAVVTWKALAAEPGSPADDGQPGEPPVPVPGAPPRRRRRRRRRGFRPAPS